MCGKYLRFVINVGFAVIIKTQLLQYNCIYCVPKILIKLKLFIGIKNCLYVQCMSTILCNCVHIILLSTGTYLNKIA